MIVCHCQSITDRDISATIDWMRRADPDTIITPGKIYHALGKRADCGGCMPLFVQTMRRSTSFGVAGPGGAVPQLRNLNGDEHEGRRQGHRLSQRRAAV